NISVEDVLRWGWHSCYGAALLWDYASWDLLSACWVKVARDVGALTALPIAVTTRALAHLVAGEFALTTELVVEVESVTETTGTFAPYAAVGLAVLADREAEAAELIETGRKDAERRGEGGGLTFIEWAAAVLCNGLGRYEQALDAAQQAIGAS